MLLLLGEPIVELGRIAESETGEEIAAIELKSRSEKLEVGDLRLEIAPSACRKPCSVVRRTCCADARSLSGQKTARICSRVKGLSCAAK